MIIFIHGEDQFRSNNYLNETIKEFKNKRDPQGYNVVVLDLLDNNNISKVYSEISASPFLADKRLIVLKNILSISDKAFAQQFIETIKNDDIPKSNNIIIYQSEKESRIKEVTTLRTLLNKQKYNKEFKLQKDVLLKNWIEELVKENKKEIQKDALEYLMDNISGDMWHLNSIIEQLCSYCSTNITLQDVKIFLNESEDENIFNLIQALLSGEKKRAHKLLKQQRQMGEEDIKIFGLIVWQFNIIIQMRDLYEREDLSSDMMSRQLSLHPFIIKKNYYLMKNFTLTQLKEIHKILLEIDIQSKTSNTNTALLLDLLIAKI